jgi:hypothetical protein
VKKLLNLPKVRTIEIIEIPTIKNNHGLAEPACSKTIEGRVKIPDPIVELRATKAIPITPTALSNLLLFSLSPIRLCLH